MTTETKGAASLMARSCSGRISEIRLNAYASPSTHMASASLRNDAEFAMSAPISCATVHTTDSARVVASARTLGRANGAAAGFRSVGSAGCSIGSVSGLEWHMQAIAWPGGGGTQRGRLSATSTGESRM
eukprot:4129837-Prymnesium_polylepis.2